MGAEYIHDAEIPAIIELNNQETKMISIDNVRAV